MSVIFILIAVSLLVAIGFLVSFIWTIRSGQYDDDYTPSVRMLFDDEKNVIEEDEEKQINENKQIPHPPAADPGQAQNQEPITNTQ